VTLVGVLGAGQLGRMLAQAGHALGLRFLFVDPTPDSPAGQIAEQIVAPYDDERALGRLAECDVVTFEFESVPSVAAEWLAPRVKVHPPARALTVAQDRVREKSAFQELGIPTADFAEVDDAQSLDAAIERVGLPAVLKTRRLGYDGKGQAVIRDRASLGNTLASLGGTGLILESFVGFTRELSLLAVRGRSGELRFYPLVENTHREGILRETLAPASNLTPKLVQQAESHASRLLTELDYVGVLALELFDVDGTLLANEIAPRVHNSGHWSIDGARTSQFENHLRAILDLPLGDADALCPSAMVNFIGSIPEAKSVLAIPDTHLHLYGKLPRPGRKVGHATVRGPDPGTLQERLARLRSLI
jgi:5-(carboxyamino)imidazole ribonucleotide synthase